MTEYQVTSLSAIARNTQRRVGRMKFPEESRSRRQVLPIPRELERQDRPPEIDAFCRNCSPCV